LFNNIIEENKLLVKAYFEKMSEFYIIITKKMSEFFNNATLYQVSTVRKK